MESGLLTVGRSRARSILSLRATQFSAPPLLTLLSLTAFAILEVNKGLFASNQHTCITKMLTLAHGLREVLSSIVQGSTTREQVSRLVKISHALATPFVASKTAGQAGNPRLGTLTPSDLAYDFIADLFRQDDAGHLVQFRVYFAGIDFSNTSDGQLLGHLRRLVFSSVNQGLFRMYNEADPSLGKILRNIKLTVVTLHSFEEQIRLGEPCLLPSMTDPLLHLPPMEQADLEKALAPLVKAREHIPDLLAALSLFLREQEENCRLVPFIMVALTFRSLYVKRQLPGDQVPDTDQGLLAQEMRAEIKEACQAVAGETGRRYQIEQGWDDAVLLAYTAVIEKQLLLRMLDTDGEGFSYFSGLKEFFPAMSASEYREQHRTKIEYLGRLAYERFLRRMRKELGR